MAEFIKQGRQIAIIKNPEVGSFEIDLKEALQSPNGVDLFKRFEDLYAQNLIIKSVLLQSDAEKQLNTWKQHGISNGELMVICKEREFLSMYEEWFAHDQPRFTLIPDESAYRRKIRVNRILFEDRFEKQEKNSDYGTKTDEHFSDDHLYFEEDGYIGFSDYSIVGKDYMEAGFAPYAVAIHIVYFMEDKSLYVKHFVSDSNNDISNPALKYYEAVSKLEKWYKNNERIVPLTEGLKTFLQHYHEQSYPGLGTVKKLSLMHHFELMGKFLDGEM